MPRDLWRAGLKPVLGLLVCAAVVFVAIAISLRFFGAPAPVPDPNSSDQEAQDQPDQAPIDRNRPRLMARLGYGVGGANVIVLSKDGKWLFTGGYDGTVGMWDFSSGMEIRAFEGLPEPVRSLALSSDGKRLVVVGGADARIFDVATRMQIPTPWGKTTHIWSAALSADDKRIVIAEDDAVRVWELATGKEVRSFKEIGRPAAILSHDGKLLLTSSSKWDERNVATFVVILWDVASGREVRTFRGHEAHVESLTLSSDDQWLVTTSDDKSARLWELATGKEIRAFMGHTAYVTCSALSADKKRLVTGGYDQTIRVWDVDTGQAIGVLPDVYHAHALVLSADGKQLATGTLARVRLWDLATGKEIRSFQRLAHHARFRSLSGDGKRLVTGEGGYWDLTTGQFVPTMAPKAAEKIHLHRTADGKWIVTSNDVSAHLWDTATGKKVRSLSWETQRFLDLSSDAKWLVSGDKDNLLRLWDLDAGTVLRTFKGHGTEYGSGYRKATMSSDKRWLLSEGFLECTTQLWNLFTGKEVLSVHNDHYWPPKGAISADSKWLAVSNEKIVQLWDLATLKQVRTFQGHANHVVSVSFSGDDQWMITRGADWGRTIDSHISMEKDKDVTYRIWHVGSGKTVANFRHPVWSFSAALSHDGKRLITGSFDGTARVRELPSGKELCRLISFVDGTWAVFDAECRYDASSKDGIDGLHWVLGDDIFPLQKFRESYYDLGLLAKYLGYNSEPLITPPPTP